MPGNSADDVTDAVVVGETTRPPPLPVSGPKGRANWLEPDAREAIAAGEKAIIGQRGKKKPGGQYDGITPKPKTIGKKPGEKGNPGRHQGAVSRFRAATRAQGLMTGKLPHEILLDFARGDPIRCARCNPTTGEIIGYTYVVPDIEMRTDCAKAAAPYYAPRLAQIDFGAAMTEEELDAAIAELTAAEAGLPPPVEGEEAEA